MTARNGVTTLILLLLTAGIVRAESPPAVDYCSRMQQEVQGRKHGFLAGNLTYYVGGFHASWKLIEHETIGLTHPFHHDLRSRGVGILRSNGRSENDTGTGNDYSGWEFYKDTRVLYGSVVIDGKVYRHPVPKRMSWRPDRAICEYEVAGVKLREEKFIAANDAACSIITSSKPVMLRFDGRSFFGRHSVTSSATINFDSKYNAIHIVEGGTTRSMPETDGSQRIGPIMYEGMSTVLTTSRSIASSHRFKAGKNHERIYEFDVQCDDDGTAIVWSMHDDATQAIKTASETVRNARHYLADKTREVNRQLNEEIPYFRCSDKKIEDIYYYLWSLYLMYYIDVQRGMEMEPHTQTAVNNFLGMHRYDAMFQIKVGAWMNDKSRFAYGNVLTWKRLFENGYYKKSPNGVIALSDNKGTTWHSGAYGNELSEHVLGAWQIYEHTGDVEFLRGCYAGYFREVFKDAIGPFHSNQFEVAETLSKMARLTGYDDDVVRWNRLVPQNAKQIREWFDRRWQANGHENYFGGPKNGMLMTNGFWHMRSKHFPREYAEKMVRSWALDRNKGFFPEDDRPFPLAMSRQSMKTFATNVDHSFGYTPDTAYLTLSGMFRQRLAKSASELTVDHLVNYNFNSAWNVPVAPEAYRRDGTLFGDQYSNFNAGKLLLILEGLAGIEYSIPENKLIVRDAMPTAWDWMEVRIPMQSTASKRTAWPVIRYQRQLSGAEVLKSVEVSDSPLQIMIGPWTEGLHVVRESAKPMPISRHQRYEFDPSTQSAIVELKLAPGD